MLKIFGKFLDFNEKELKSFGLW